MTNETHSSARNGWSLLEALERTADPYHWRQWLAAKSSFEQINKSIPAGPGSILESPSEKRRAARLAVDSTFQMLNEHLFQFVEQERIFAFGSRGGIDLPPSRISPLEWKSLGVKDWEKSQMVERGDPIPLIHDVRLYPLVHAKDAPQHLADLSLSEAFQRCVLQDPEVAARGIEVMKAGSDRAVFLEGQYPGPFDVFRWPVGQNAEDLAFEFVRPVAYFLDSPLPKPSVQKLNAARALSNRWNGLLELLQKGSIIAFGTFAGTGLEQKISSRQWARTGMSVDIQNGDLLEGQGHTAAPIWTGIYLSLPQSLMLASASSETGKDIHSQVEQTKRASETPTALTTAASYTACRDWLIKAMRSSPNERIRTKAWWLAESQKKWPGTLSKRSFGSAWSEAVRITNAATWAAAGAPKKINQPQSVR